jgi:hypothetical protein
MKYRKKPVVIDAVQWTGSNLSEIADLIGRADNVFVAGDTIKIKTLEGTMVASPGDWIIIGVKKEIYPCKPDIFSATYEPVEKDPFASGPVEIIGKD